METVKGTYDVAVGYDFGRRLTVIFSLVEVKTDKGIEVMLKDFPEVHRIPPPAGIDRFLSVQSLGKHLQKEKYHNAREFAAILDSEMRKIHERYPKNQ